MIKSLKSKDLSSQIIQEIVLYIQEQSIGIGTKFPPQNVISKMMGVSMVSLREAFTRLESKGIIEQRHGVGTFLVKDPTEIEHKFDLSLSVTDMIEQTGKIPGLKEFSIGFEVPPSEINDLIQTKNEVLCLRRVRTADGIPFSYSVAFILNKSLDLSMKNFKDYNFSLYKYLQETKDIFIKNCEGVLKICKAEDDICEKLEIPLGSHLLQLNQQHYSVDGELILVSIDLLTEQFNISMNRYEIGII